jgi:DNA polymerase III delta prime subunit
MAASELPAWEDARDVPHLLFHGIDESVVLSHCHSVVYSGGARTPYPDLLTVKTEFGEEIIPCVRTSCSIEVRADTMCTRAARTYALLPALFAMRKETAGGIWGDSDEDSVSSLFWIVLHGVSDLSAQASTMLRKWMETKCDSIRVLMTCRDPSSLLPALRSRVCSVRCAPPVHAGQQETKEAEKNDASDEELVATLCRHMMRSAPSFEAVRNAMYSILVPFLSPQELCTLLLTRFRADLNVAMVAGRRIAGGRRRDKYLHVEPVLFSAWSKQR